MIGNKFFLYDKEIPYHCEVYIDYFKEEDILKLEQLFLLAEKVKSAL